MRKSLEEITNAVYHMAEHGCLWEATVKIERLKKASPEGYLMNYLQDIENQIDNIRGSLKELAEQQQASHNALDCILGRYLMFISTTLLGKCKVSQNVIKED